MAWIILLCTIISLLFLLLISYVKRKHKYWADRRVPYLRPHPIWGNIEGVGSKEHIDIVLKKCYEGLKGRGAFAGIYLLHEPVVLATDLDFLKNILVKDFQNFHDRGMYINERDDPLSSHLFSLPGQQWKALRAKLTPTFTSGKMKLMHPTILDVASQFKDHLTDILEGQTKELELKDLFSRFTTDLIAKVAFGVECNSLKEPNNEFRRIGCKCVKPDTITIIKNLFVGMFPNVSKTLRIALMDAEVTKFFMRLLSDTVKYREENDVQRRDFMSLLLQLKNTGRLEGDDVDLGQLTFNELAAQMFLFFLAGFETSSSTMTFAMYELALNPEIQKMARDEVDEVIRRHDGKLCYEAAMELNFVDQVIHGVNFLFMFPVFDL